MSKPAKCLLTFMIVAGPVLMGLSAMLSDSTSERNHQTGVQFEECASSGSRVSGGMVIRQAPAEVRARHSRSSNE